MEEEEEERTGTPPERREKSAAEMRKINKPLMERKRRERINNCLNQLKLFLMEATKKDSSYYSKLEKADILEMTVKYLKNLQRQQMAVVMATDPKVASKYSAGYSQCVSEVTRFLNKVEGFHPEMRNRLVNHLSNCVQKVAQGPSQPSTPVVQMPLPQSQPVGLQVASPLSVPQQQHPMELQLSAQLPQGASVNAIPSTSGSMLMNPSNGPAAAQGGQGALQNVPVLPVQFIPAKLPGGELVLLMANTQSVPTVTNLVSPMTIQVPSISSVVGVDSGSLSVNSPAAPVTTQTNSTPIIAHTSAASAMAQNLSGSAVAIVPPQVQEPKNDFSMTKPINLSMHSKSSAKETFSEVDPKPGPSSAVYNESTSFFYRQSLKPHNEYRPSPTHTVSRPNHRDNNQLGQPEPEAGQAQGQGHGHGHNRPEVNPNVDSENMWRPW